MTVVQLSEEKLWLSEEKLLLVDLLTFVAGYTRDIEAAKKLLLDHFDRHHEIDWDFEVEFEVVPTGGSRPPPPIEVLAIELGFWRREEDSRIDVDWGASSAVRVGSLMRVDYEPHDPYDPDDPPGECYRLLFDLHYQVTLRASLIRIDPTPVIAWLRWLGLRPPAATSPVHASSAAVSPNSPAGNVDGQDMAAMPTDDADTPEVTAEEVLPPSTAAVRNRDEWPTAKQLEASLTKWPTVEQLGIKRHPKLSDLLQKLTELSASRRGVRFSIARLRDGRLDAGKLVEEFGPSIRDSAERLIKRLRHWFGPPN